MMMEGVEFFSDVDLSFESKKLGIGDGSESELSLNVITVFGSSVDLNGIIV